MAYHAEHAQHIELERLERGAVYGGMKVVRECFGLAQRELGGRGARLAGFAIRHQGAITHGPESCITGHHQGLLYQYSAPFVMGAWQGLQQWIGSRACSPDKRLGAYLLLGADPHGAASRTLYPSIQQKGH